MNLCPYHPLPLFLWFLLSTLTLFPPPSILSNKRGVRAAHWRPCTSSRSPPASTRYFSLPRTPSQRSPAEPVMRKIYSQRRLTQHHQQPRRSKHVVLQKKEDSESAVLKKYSLLVISRKRNVQRILHRVPCIAYLVA